MCAFYVEHFGAPVFDKLVDEGKAVESSA